MDRIKKGLVCLLVFLIFAYCVFFDYPSYSKDVRVKSEEIKHTSINTGSPKPETETEKDKGSEEESEEEQSSVSDESSDEEKLAEVEDTLKKLYKYAPSNAYVGIEYINSFVYDYMFPVLQDVGSTGLLVLRNGVLPGDERRITVEQAQEMVDAGWSFAVGANFDIDLTTYSEETALEWGAYLQEYSGEIRERMGKAPNIYCFDEGEYHPEYDKILAMNGFNVILYYDDSADNVVVMDKMVKINCVRITAETKGEDLISTVKNYHNVVTMVHLTESSPTDESINTFSGQYKDLLTALNDSDSIELHSFSELEGIILKAPEGINQTYARIKQLEQERDELLKKLNKN